MRRRWRRPGMWTLMVTSVWLPYAAHSHSAAGPLAEQGPVGRLEAHGLATLHHATQNALQAVVAVEAARSVVRQVNHAGDPNDAMKDCQTRWGQDLGPVLCPAMFQDGDKSQKPATTSVETKLLGALWHMAGRQAGVWWQQGKTQVASAWAQVRALPLLSDDSP